MRGTTTVRPAGRARWLRRAATTASAGALVAVTALGVSSASGRQVTQLGLTIDPTSGPIGTVITATITGCIAGASTAGARLDFAFLGLTPSNTVFFMPDGDGTDVVDIEAMEKLPQSEGLTDGEVVVTQCVVAGGAGAEEVGAAQVGEEARAPFTVIRAGPEAPPAPPVPPAPPPAQAPAAVGATPTFTG